MKVNLGSSKIKRSFFPSSLDSSTTCNFGECVPLFSKEVPQQSNLRVDLRSAVRFAPLSLPTFGNASFHSYLFAHRIQDLYPPYNDLLARTPFTSSGSSTSYIPTKVPSLTLADLWTMVLIHCKFTIYNAVLPNPSSSELQSPLNVFRYKFSDFNANYDVSLTPKQYSYGFVRTLLNLSNSQNANGFLSYLTPTTISRNDWLLFSGTYDDGSCPSEYIPFSSESAITPQGSDFIIPVSPSDSNGQGIFYFDPTSKTFKYSYTDNTKVIICVKLTNSGKFLRKILMGLGYHIKNVNKELSVLELYAFFKSYFQEFAPKRFLKFEQTYFYTAINNCVQLGINFAASLIKRGQNMICLFSNIIDELLSCYYTSNTDYYSSQIIGLVNSYGSNIAQQYLGVNRDDERDLQVSNEQLVSSVTNNLVPSIDLSGDLQHTQSQQNILQRLTNLVNRRSLLGGKIGEFLESTFGIKAKSVIDEYNPYVGSSITDVQFSDVFSTAETAEASLGEYAGKAFGKNTDGKFNVECDVPTIVVAFGCVVPRTQFVQGLSPHLSHIYAEDFYNPSFDGLTLLPTDKLSLYCVESPNDYFSSTAPDLEHSFGNQSIYQEYKVKTQGILNGDLSLLSTRSSYDSFTLDRVCASSVIQYDEDGEFGNEFVFASPSLPNISAGTMWRYVGRWLWLGSFDRIFVNARNQYKIDYLNASLLGWNSRDSSINDDNLVCHNVVDFALNSAMLPVEDSFMTKDIEDLYNSVGFRSQSE